MKAFCLILLLCQSILCESEDKFFYQTKDYLQIDQKSSMQVQLTLSSKADQYTSEGKLSITLILAQNTSLPFNILYFNNQNTSGQQCYQNWIQNNQVSAITPCSLLNSATEQSMPDCMNYTNCIDQNVRFSVHLSDNLFKQNYIVLQNNNNEMIGVETSMKVELDSDNWWFYWGVGLTCLLMISLVIFSGIVFYWSLKYKKMKKMFDQFKLTEDSQSIKKD